jgi:ArsR family transcriptional regulator, arsenate/arsenite/antimonite-responsive transcriptional repressor
MESIITSPRAVVALAALAHTHRLAVYRLLVQAGPEGLRAGSLATQLELPPSSLSFHLSHLLAAGIITQTRQSRMLIYRADYAAMDSLMRFLTDNCCQGMPCGVQFIPGGHDMTQQVGL